jgi:integrase
VKMSAGPIRVHIALSVGDVDAEMLTRDEVREALKKVMIPKARGNGPPNRPRGGKKVAKVLLGALRHMIAWGSEEGKLKRNDNPASGMEKNSPKKKQGERVLSLDEANAAWRTAGTLGYPFGLAYRLILLTGCRPGEWSKCVRLFVDRDQSLPVLPAISYQSDHVQVVPLMAEAAEILRHVLTDILCQSGEYIFSGIDGRGPLAGWSRAQDRILKAVCAESGNRVLEPRTPHDLRRTVATRIAEALDIGGQLIKKVVGRSDGSVTAVYNRRSRPPTVVADQRRGTVSRLDPRGVARGPAHRPCTARFCDRSVTCVGAPI